jgi:hypothetical protein
MMITDVTSTKQKQIPAGIRREIFRIINNINYGSVEITIHNEQIVQIECREKIRINQAEPVHKLRQQDQ